MAAPRAAERGRARGLALRAVEWSDASHGALLASAAVLWAFSLRNVDQDRIAGLGLLDALPATFFIAFALLLIGFAGAVLRDELPTRLLWTYVIALIVVVHGTTPILYDVPRYPWTYKHLGVSNLIAATGGIDRGIDIYHNWPGFFALTAWLSSATGVQPIDYAEWTQVFFNLVNVLAVRFALRGLTHDERLLWGATWLFVLGNWVGQDYFAPQALAYLLTLVVLGLCLRCGSATEEASPRIVRALRALARLVGGRALEDHAPDRPLSSRGALLVGGVCYAALIVTHPLSPVIAVLSAFALWLVLHRIPLWVPGTMAVVEVWWVSLAWPFVHSVYEPVSFDPLNNISPSGGVAYDGLPGLNLTAWSARGLVALMLVLAVVGLVRRLRAGHSDMPAVILVLVLVPLVFFVSYGTETGLRTYLFSLPWLSFFAAAARLPVGAAASSTPLARRPFLLATGAVGACLLCAYFGLELANRIVPSDVRTAVWLENHAVDGAAVLYVCPDFPKRLTANYSRILRAEGNYNAFLLDEAPLPGRYIGPFRDHLLGLADVPNLQAVVDKIDAPQVYVVLSDSQDAYLRLYGLLPDGSVPGLSRALAATPSFRLVHRDGPSVVFASRPEAVALRPASQSRPGR